MTAPEPEAALVGTIAEAILGELTHGRGPAGPRARDRPEGEQAMTAAIALRAVREMTAAGWTPPPTTDPDRCRYCGRTSHGFACRGLLDGSGCPL